MSAVELKKVKQKLVDTVVQPLYLGGTTEDGVDAKLTITNTGKLQVGTPSSAIVYDGGGNAALDINKIATNAGRYTRQVYTQVNSTSYSFSTTWAVGPTFPVVNGFKAGSLVKITYGMPTRNDSTSWGGGYIEPQININGTGWQSLGSSGYDAGVMGMAALIGSYSQSILIDPGMSTDFSLEIRFYARSYDGTLNINGSNEINVRSGTATLMSGNNGLQHYAHVIVEELAILRGNS